MWVLASEMPTMKFFGHHSLTCVKPGGGARGSSQSVITGKPSTLTPALPPVSPMFEYSGVGPMWR